MCKVENVLCVIPSRLGVGEPFQIKVKVLGREFIEMPYGGTWRDWKPQSRSCFNINVRRDIRFTDNCLPEWAGRLVVDGGETLEGPGEILFDGKSQGVCRGDTRPIKTFSGFRWRRPGFHFLQLIEPESGRKFMANPVYVTEKKPDYRIFWGDPHWQTYFSDGIRCPEELYAFARDEGFLDFGAISDHMEAVTDLQWQYFQSVTDYYNEPHKFVTLHGQEWTNHLKNVGAPGHRNVYFRRAGGPALRCTDEHCNTLEKLWRILRENRDLDPIAIPHHTSNTAMGVDWEQGWNPEFEKAVEIFSVWGSSEKPADRGNPFPLQSNGGEMKGRHIVDALDKGYKFGFVGGGDIHDGRPGDCLHNQSYQSKKSGKTFISYPEGFTAALVPALTRDNIHHAIKNHHTYATTQKRIYMDMKRLDGKNRFSLQCASEEGIKHITCVKNGRDDQKITPDDDQKIVETEVSLENMGPKDYVYYRLVTFNGNTAWTSPIRRG